MPDKTKVEWAEATINPFPGCSPVKLASGETSPACVGCYAARGAAISATYTPFSKYSGLAVLRGGEPSWTGAVGYEPSELERPRAWTRPRRIFVESMGDVAHETLTFQKWRPLWDLLAHNADRAEPHDFYLLTKRPRRLRELLEEARELSARDYWRAMDRVVCMTTAEHQAAADERIPELLSCPARHFGVSAEPLVGPLSLERWLPPAPAPGHRWGECLCDEIDASDRPCLVCDARAGVGWVIAGGWSGAGASPTPPARFRALRDEAQSAGVPFFFKQWGEWAPASSDEGGGETLLVEPDGRVAVSGEATPEAVLMRRVGKRLAGRVLDGARHDQHPRLKR